MSVILELKNLGYTYGKGTPFEKRAVDNVSLSINQGELVGIIGHTGSGKSTLVQMLNGLIRPTDGQVLLEGRDIWEKPKEIRKIRFRVGMVFQYPEYQLLRKPCTRTSLSVLQTWAKQAKSLIQRYKLRRALPD